VKAWYFIQKSEFLGHSTRFIGTVLDEHGGIRLYRNGYRVPPYGEKHDDWLGLDVKNTQIYAPLNSKAFMGFVAVNDAEGRVFEETSSREGLIHTPALEEVRQVTKSILTAAAGRIEAARGRGRKPTKAKESDAGKKAASEAEEAAAGLETLIADVEKDGGAGLDPQLQDRLIAIAEKVSQAARVSAEVARERDELVAELGMLRILASMGLTIAEFTHDFSALAETMELNLDEIAVELPGGAEAFGVSFEHFRSQFRQVRAYTAHFSAMTTRNASRELQSIDLYNFVREFQKELAVMFERRGMQFEIERPEVYDLRTVPMHRSEWSSILLNLLTNAIKASDRAGRTGQFLLRFGELPGNKVYLDFCDNGDGIPAENRKVVFDAFFTTSGGAGARASETRQALGTGLGLKIVADIASAAGGEVTVCDEVPAGYHTCIRVTVPGARDRTES
jgi:signal transduction histidine kinase